MRENRPRSDVWNRSGESCSESCSLIVVTGERIVTGSRLRTNERSVAATIRGSPVVRTTRSLGVLPDCLYHSKIRSEERRVGKECRYRWVPHHLKQQHPHRAPLPTPPQPHPASPP